VSVRPGELQAGYRLAQLFDRGERVLWGVLYLVPDQHDAERVMALGAEEQLGRDSYPVTLLAHPLDERARR
jgi:hypothetical protein